MSETIKLPYGRTGHVYQGRICDILPELLERGIVLQTMRDALVAQTRDARHPLVEPWLHTADAYVAIPLPDDDELIRIVRPEHQCGNLGLIKPDRDYADGALILKDDELSMFRRVPGWLRSDLVDGRYVNQDLTQEQVNVNPIWLDLARGDEKLLMRADRTLYHVLRADEQDLGRRVRLDDPIGRPRMRLFVAGGLYNYLNGSVTGNGDLDGINGRLVGVEPRRPNAARKR